MTQMTVSMRRIFQWSICWLVMLGQATLAWGEAAPPPIRIGMTPAIVHDQYEVLSAWRQYFERQLGRPVEFVSRDSYRETIDLLKQRELDFAWVSDYPFVYMNELRIARLLAVPLYHGRPTYRAYLIAPAGDRQTTSILQLKDRVFAFADPYSHTGYLYPRHVLHAAGEDPGRFFRRSYFTWSHRHVVEAVARGFADGGSVDSYVWDSLALLDPGLTARTRIVSRSPEYGFPPMVANRSVNRADFAAMQGVLLGMAADPDGAKLLRRLNLDGFVRGDARLYDEVKAMMPTLVRP